MSKSLRMEQRIREIAGSDADRNGIPPAFAAYFVCFNAGEYYEAHDVLEHLWLQTQGPEHAFFKGFIQLAGAFVHLRKHYLRPHHHKDGRRLAPAARLFRLALGNWECLPGTVCGLELEAPRNLSATYFKVLEDSGFTINPWRPETAPKLHPPSPKNAPVFLS